MSITTGIGGVVVSNQTVKKFSLNMPRQLKTLVSSGAAGGETKLPGNIDWSGSFDFYGFIPTSPPGTSFTFTGQKESAGGSSTWWTGTAMIESVNIKCGTEGAEPLMATVKFAANGALSAATGAAKTDVAAPSFYSSISLGADFAGSAIADVRSWDLTLARELKPYNSSTTGAQTLRKAGNWKASASITAYQSTPSSILTAGTVDQLKLYCTSTLYWDLKYGALAAVDDEVDIEGANIQGVKYDFEWSYYKNITGTWTVGYIKTPEASPTTYFP